ncbi:hypothetical protein C6A85_11095, partial [Mycobacterium sp. ITM-2017-0098]
MASHVRYSVSRPKSLIDRITSCGYRAWMSRTDRVASARDPGREPLIPPAELPHQVAAAQAAVMTLSVFLDRLRTGEGDLID